jgi:hypothetical protein
LRREAQVMDRLSLVAVGGDQMFSNSCSSQHVVAHDSSLPMQVQKDFNANEWADVRQLLARTEPRA